MLGSGIMAFVAYSVVRDLVVGGSDLRLYASGVGRPVVMLHALATTASSFEAAAHPLIAAGHEVVALDLPGHGGSDPVRGSELDAYVEALIEALEQAIDSPIDLVGHEFGGYLALTLTVARPDLVRSVVVEEPLVPPRSGRGPASVVPTSVRVRRVVTVARQGRYGLARVRAIVDQVRTADPAWWTRLSSIRVPVLVLDGGGGRARSGIDLDDLSAAIPGAVRGSVDAGHRLHQAAPDQFAALVVPFLAGVRPPAQLHLMRLA
jgi:pimeloyl-ACP methyl ester carboxylesterase